GRPQRRRRTRRSTKAGAVRVNEAGRGAFVAIGSPRGQSGPQPAIAGAALSGTARSWRDIVPFTHLAREGRMTVTIGRRELLAALGGAAAAWPLAARAQREAKTARIGFLGADTEPGISVRVERFR